MKTLMQWGEELSWKPLSEKQEICKQMILEIQPLYLSTKLNASSDTLLQTLYSPEIVKLERLATLLRVCLDGRIGTMCCFITNEGWDALAIKWLEARYP